MRLSTMWSSLVVPDDLGYFRCRDRYLVENPGLAAWAVLTEEELGLLRALAGGAAPPPEFAPPPEPDGRCRLERVLAVLVLNWLVYLPGQRPRLRSAEPRLRTVRYAITHGCRPPCRDCPASCTHRLPGELEPAESLDLVDQIADLGAELLVLTGGEPMLRRDLFELAERARSRGVPVNLVTTGSRIRDAATARRIADTFAGITVSLYGGGHEVPGAVPGENTLARTVRGLTLLNAAGVKPAIDHVVSPENIAALDSLMSFLDGVEFSRVRMMSHSAVDRGTPDGLHLGWEQLGAEHLPARRSAWTSPVARKLLSRGPIAARSCPVPADRGLDGLDIHVDPGGDVYPRGPVAGPPQLAGNLRSQPLHEMFAPPGPGRLGAPGVPRPAGPGSAARRTPVASTADHPRGRCRVTVGINSAIVWVDDDEEVRLYNPDDGEFQTFNASAARIWRRLAAGSDVPTVVRELADAFGGGDGREREAVARDVREFVALLRARDLLRSAEPSGPAGEGGHR
ncbi:PqqD family peptide modification chaperone [Plantactinospora veratri]|uniref:PqqD family peptide modification chaperone n=1 Tax=Plantactinospora veratri TaxID=1436122 RepID=A0ABU7S6Q9_9ACTN